MSCPPRFFCASGGVVEGLGAVAAGGAEEVAGLVGGDGEEPGSEAAAGVEGFGVAVDLDEGLLKEVVGGGGVGNEPTQEREEFLLVARDEFCEGALVSVGVGVEELFVRDHGGRPLVRRWGREVRRKRYEVEVR